MRNRYDYPDDLFAESRMSFGDHIEELRTRMWAAIKGLLICMLLGFVLDTIGTQLDMPNFGIGRPMLAIIKKPVEDKMQEFYNERVWNEKEKLRPEPANREERNEREREKEKFLAEHHDRARRDATAEINAGHVVTIRIPAEELNRKRVVDEAGDVSIPVKIAPLEFAIVLSEAQKKIGKQDRLTTLSAQEGFVVYFKVSILCGVVMASPWILWQFWAFVGAGLYPHEKKHLNRFLPYSLGLFFAGILLCQFWVLPGTVKALLAFNEWLELDPDLRLNEWLGLALILPLVFGISFQTPLIMLAMNQVGIFSPEAYLSKWRHATMIIAFFAAVVTPTPDVVTMMYLFLPMMGLYFFGIYLCKLFPQRSWLKGDEETKEEMAEVAV